METITVYVALSKNKECEGYFASEDKALEVSREFYRGSVKAEEILLKDWELYHVDTSLPEILWRGV